MPEVVCETKSASVLFDKLPLEIRQHTSKFSAAFLALLFGSAVAAVMVPFAMVAAHAALEPAVIASIWAKPLASIQILAAGVLWSLVIILPLKGLLSRLGRDRTIRISDGIITVEDHHVLRRSTWSAPLEDFKGIVHDIRATHSGTRHELTLVHDNKKKCLRLCTAGRIGQATIDRACALLALPQLPAQVLHFPMPRRRDSIERSHEAVALAAIKAT